MKRVLGELDVMATAEPQDVATYEEIKEEGIPKLMDVDLSKFVNVQDRMTMVLWQEIMQTP